MSNTNATVDLNSSGIYTLNVSMREDGLRLDKLMLVTDTATIPTGQGLLESPTTNALPNLDSHTIQYGYDLLYRPTDVTYSGDITATYQYEYNEVGNRTTYTATIMATQVTTYTYNDANQLVTAKEASSPDTWHYVYDDNGNLVRQVPNGLTAASGEVRYTFNQRNLLVQIENHDGSGYLPQAEMGYDGAGNRLQSVSFILGSAVTTTYTLDSLNNRLPLALDNGTDSRTILYGRFGLGEFSTEWTYYLGDGQLSVRQLMDSSGNIALSRTYGPFGQILQEMGDGSAIYGFAGAQADGGGLLYINGRYFDPTTGRYLSPDDNFDPMRPGTLNGYLSAAFLFVPFSAIIWRKRKKRGGRYDLMLFLVLGIGLGMMLVSCGGSEDGGGTPTHFFGTDTPIVTGQPPALAPIPSSTPPPPTSIPTNVPTATPNNPATPTPSPTPCPTPTQTPTPYPTIPAVTPAHETYETIRSILFTRSPEMIEPSGKINDQAIIAMIIYGEFNIISYDSAVFGEALEAVSFQYLTPDQYANGCKGFCETIDEQIKWLQDIEAWGFVSSNQYGESRPDHVLGPSYTEWKAQYWDNAGMVMQSRFQYGPRMASVVWGNLRINSPGWKYFNTGGELDWWDINNGSPFEAYNNDFPSALGVFVVMTSSQNNACKTRPSGSCSGF